MSKLKILIVVIVGGLSVFYFVYKNKEQVEYITSKIERGDLIQTVSEVGVVKANEEVDLSFLQNGKLNKIFVNIGDEVEEGQILAELDYSSLLIKKQEAMANLEVAKANLSKLLAGATKEAITVAEANLAYAKTAYYSALNEMEKTKNLIKENNKQAEKTLFDLESDDSSNITPYEQAVITAQTNLNNTKDTYQKKLDHKKEDLIVVLESKLAIAKTALDAVNTILNDDDLSKVFSAKNYVYSEKTDLFYNQSLILLNEANNFFNDLKNKKTTNIDLVTDKNLESLNNILNTLNYCFKALENSVVSSSLTQTELDTFKSSISSQLTLINTAISSVQTAKQSLDSAILSYRTNVSSSQDSLDNAKVNLQNAIKTAKDNLEKVKKSGEQSLSLAQSKVDSTFDSWKISQAKLKELKAPPRTEDVLLQKAKVKQVESSLSLIEKQIDDSIIKSPIKGKIIKINYEVGEQISMSKPVIRLLGKGDFLVEVDISETDIAKIKIGNSVDISLDAFGDDIIFKGKVSFIEPAETVIQDVIYYKVKVKFNVNQVFDKHSQFLDIQKRNIIIKPGMTANITITTAKKDNILMIPMRAVIEKNGDGKFYRVLENGKLVEKKIHIGLSGDDGMFEVLSKVREGEEVIVSIKDKK